MATLPSGISPPKRFALGLSWMKSELQFHECQETVQYEPGQLVRLLFVLGLRHKLWNLNQLSAYWSSHWSCSTFQQRLFSRMTHLRKLLQIGCFSPVFRSSEDILAICNRRWIITPWRLHQRVYFLRFHILQQLLVFLLSRTFFEVISLPFGLRPNSSHNSETAP